MSNTTDEGLFVVDGALPEIARVQVLDRLRIAVVWSTGRADELDLAPDIFNFKHYAPLRDDRALFETMHVVDGGNAIAWGDDDIVMPATAVERLADDIMTSEHLRQFMRSASLTRDALAAQLGVSRRLVGYWLEGQIIPRYIALACRAIGRFDPERSENWSPVEAK